MLLPLVPGMKPVADQPMWRRRPTIILLLVLVAFSLMCVVWTGTMLRHMREEVALLRAEVGTLRSGSADSPSSRSFTATPAQLFSIKESTHWCSGHYRRGSIIDYICNSLEPLSKHVQANTDQLDRLNSTVQKLQRLNSTVQKLHAEMDEVFDQFGGLHWIIASANQACTGACASQKARCVEDHWPTSEAEANRSFASAGVTCKSIGAGFEFSNPQIDDPTDDNHGYCFWQSQLPASDGRCDLVYGGAGRAIRICPCFSV